MKRLLILTIAAVVLISCDDILWPDGPTKMKGYVIDQVSNQKISNAKVYLKSCHIRALAGSMWCHDLLDSTQTDASGYYELNFKDRKKWTLESL